MELPPSRRPDGTMRKPVRIRAGYVPQEEVAIYQSKGTLWKNSASDVPPGYDPEDVQKPKTKTAKRNEKRNEKRKQANALNSSESDERLVEAVSSKMASMNVEADPSKQKSIEVAPQPESGSSKSEIDKKIRALKKKIRLARSGAQAAPEKVSKLEAWERELSDLESSTSIAP